MKHETRIRALLDSAQNEMQSMIKSYQHELAVLRRQRDDALDRAAHTAHDLNETRDELQNVMRELRGCRSETERHVREAEKRLEVSARHMAEQVKEHITLSSPAHKILDNWLDDNFIPF